MKYKIGGYVLRVWLASTLTIGALFVLIFGLTQQKFQDLTFASFISYEVIALLFVFTSMLLSIPAQVIFYYSARLLVNWVRDPVKQKIWFNIIAVGVMLGTFFQILVKVPGYEKSFYHPLIAGYCVVISAGVWWFKLKPAEDATTATLSQEEDNS